MTNFRIKAIGNTFDELFDLSEEESSAKRIIKMVVDEYPGFPCRVSLEDAPLGEEVLLLPFRHHNTNSPYQASGPIFVRKNVTPATMELNEIPEMLQHRLLSLRGYDKSGMMKHASVTEGSELKEQIACFFEDEAIEYIQIHNARPGCYNCQVDRVR